MRKSNHATTYGEVDGIHAKTQRTSSARGDFELRVRSGALPATAWDDYRKAYEARAK